MSVEDEVHNGFVNRTDRRSLYNQLKALVAKAHEVDYNELQQRRKDLQKLMETEDKIYEEEFAHNVKSRIDEDIKARKMTLVKIKEQNDKQAEEFLESKRVQQYMNNCYDIREALRHKQFQSTKECLLEQIDEKERALAREKKLDKYWLEVNRSKQEMEETRHNNEMCMRRTLALKNKEVLDGQMVELAHRRDELRKEKQAEIEEIAKIMEEMRLQEFERHITPLSPKVLEYRNELLEDIKARHDARRQERDQQAEEHRHLIAEVQLEEAEKKAAALARKRSMHAAIIDYIGYVRRMRKLDKVQQDARDACHDELGRVDQCTKRNIKLELERKAKIAADSYAVLLRQICEQRERQLREELERREDKILENLFARPNITKEEIKQRQLKQRQDLDAQIVELNRIRRMEEEKYAAELERASNDAVFCEQLYNRVLTDGIDYLPPHPNWRILVCPNKEHEFVEKKRQAYPDCSELSNGGQAMSSELCGCQARFQRTICGGKRKSGGMGDSCN